MIWYVHRNADKSIASAHEEPQADYAEEALDDQAPELAAWFAAVRNPVPDRVTPLQIRMALRRMNLLDQVDAYIAQQTSDMQDAWEWASTVPRDNPMVVAVETALGVDGDALFKLASTLP